MIRTMFNYQSLIEFGVSPCVCLIIISHVYVYVYVLLAETDTSFFTPVPNLAINSLIPFQPILIILRAGIHLSMRKD